MWENKYFEVGDVIIPFKDVELIKGNIIFLKRPYKFFNQNVEGVPVDQIEAFKKWLNT